MYKVNPASNKVLLFGEAPLWDHRRGQLVVTDCFGKEVNLLDPDTGEMTSKPVRLPNNEGLTYIVFSMPYANLANKFLVATSTGKLVDFDWNEEKVNNVVVDLNTPLKNYVDAKCDKNGRLWVGTATFADMGTLSVVPNKGNLHKVTKSVSGKSTGITLTEEGGNFDVPNGLGWNKDQTKLFWNDLTRQITNVYDYDLASGTLGNRKLFFDFGQHPELSGSYADGLCVDASGNVWIACWKGGCVIKVDGQTGRLLDKIAIPATNVTSVCFGGKNLDVLYVTTTSVELDQSKVNGEPDAGKVFQITSPQNDTFCGIPESFLDL